MVKPIRETKEAYYYKFPKGRYYVIRWLGDGGYHYYPTSDGKLPRGFASKKAVDKHLDEWGRDDRIIVSGVKASKYPVPKRW